MSALTDQEITNALLAGGGILTSAARYLTERLGRPVTREVVAERLEGSRVLRMVQQIAKQRAIERSIAGAKQRRKERRSAIMKASWAERKAHAGKRGGSDTAPGDPNDLDHLDASNARARARDKGYYAGRCAGGARQATLLRQDPQGNTLHTTRRPWQGSLSIAWRQKHRAEDRRRYCAHRGCATSPLGTLQAGAPPMTPSIVVGAVVAGLLGALMFAGLIAIVVICLDVHDG